MTTNSDEIVCECGHAMIAHENGNNCLVRTDQWTPTYCPCEQFTDARLAALRAENEQLERSLKASYINLSHSSQVCLEQQRRGDHWELKCKGLLDEVARLTPQMVREVPTKEGWYWRFNDEISEWETVHVRADLDGRLYTESRDDDGTVVIDLVLHGKRWSKEPLPMPVIEKEGTE